MELEYELVELASNIIDSTVTTASHDEPLESVQSNSQSQLPNSYQMSKSAEYDFYSEPPVGIYYEPIPNYQSNSATSASVSDLGRYEGAYEETAIRRESFVDVLQSSRQLLYGDLMTGSDLPNFAMILNSTVSHAVIPSARSNEETPSQPTRPTKRTELINIGVSSQRSKKQNDESESCVVCSLPLIKGKPGKNCTQSTGSTISA